jgi:hypothetical protein
MRGQVAYPYKAILFAFVIETSGKGASAAIENKIIVYLPFEDIREDVQSGLDFIVRKTLSIVPASSAMLVLSWPAKPCNWAKKSW